MSGDIRVEAGELVMWVADNPAKISVGDRYLHQLIVRHNFYNLRHIGPPLRLMGSAFTLARPEQQHGGDGHFDVDTIECGARLGMPCFRGWLLRGAASQRVWRINCYNEQRQAWDATWPD